MSGVSDLQRRTSCASNKETGQRDLVVADRVELERVEEQVRVVCREFRDVAAEVLAWLSTGHLGRGNNGAVARRARAQLGNGGGWEMD